MAKKAQKPQKGSGGRTQTHLHARVAYLCKAADYLQSATSHKPGKADNKSQVIYDTTSVPEQNISKETQQLGVSHGKDMFSSISRQYGNQLRAVSQKSQIRLVRETKRSICKRCDSLLRSGVTCLDTVENKSRGRKKPWADTRVITCGFCGTQKRFPQGVQKSVRLADRRKPHLPKETVPSPQDMQLG
ncbi:RNAse P Rpr2/Rpp21 subunit domain-containing protein [Nannizzia gypsea CBS 118893]|uniref:RNAse P Rpr2/Rpp21 subunit domain-containing protein n=1 Tax=Arthroderma gypseum (strain ATCC MYA-4604 / CBS 118893) TaxID=535722 RepID=E5R3Q6_ARTGP|nr:RNAse P Rpr2/Rpp21 subunit domain-containing protein [Nannizzia gypsea CBS 118893]EFQ97180.1 RNAse P Rpr2/Rpp21 subunit domain-containing protein [Nannizzia gypsea CBS 118893]